MTAWATTVKANHPADGTVIIHPNVLQRDYPKNRVNLLVNYIIKEVYTVLLAVHFGDKNINDNKKRRRKSLIPFGENDFFG